MEPITLLNFCKPIIPISAAASNGCLLSTADGCLEEEEEEESFFELEFTLPDYDHQADCKEDGGHQKIGRIGDFIFGEKQDDSFCSKPQSPMSILRQSAPKLRVFMFGNLIKKSKPDKSRTSIAAAAGSDSTVPKRKTKIDFTVKLRIEGSAASKKRFSRGDSSRVVGRGSSNGGGDREIEGSSRRFSKDSVHKYLNLIKKPLYVKISSMNSNSKRSSDQREPFDSAGAAAFVSPRKSEERANSRFRVPCKNLRKSRSAGGLLVGISSPPASAVWKDDSLAQQNDGIQGAILHCKQSLNSSPKEQCMVSRCCASDKSHDKTIQRTE